MFNFSFEKFKDQKSFQRMINYCDTFSTSNCSNIFYGFNGFYGVLVMLHRFANPPASITKKKNEKRVQIALYVKPAWSEKREIFNPNIDTYIPKQFWVENFSPKKHKFYFNFIICRFLRNPISIEWNIHLIFICCCFSLNALSVRSMLHIYSHFSLSKSCSFCRTTELCRRIERYQITTRKQEETEEKINYL